MYFQDPTSAHTASATAASDAIRRLCGPADDPHAGERAKNSGREKAGVLGGTRHASDEADSYRRLRSDRSRPPEERDGVVHERGHQRGQQDVRLEAIRS